MKKTSAASGLFGLLLAGLLVSSCGSDDPAPLQPAGEDTTRSMLEIEGVPRVSVLLEGSVVEATSAGPLTGSFRAIVEDSTGQRVFLPRVRMNGAELEEQTDGLGNPVQSTLDVKTALPDLRLSDRIDFAVEDGGSTTPPFTLELTPSQVELLPDSSVVSKAGSIRFRWSGRIERLILNFTDRFGTRVRVTLVFENYSGLREIVVPGRDLSPLAPGELQVAASITDSEARFPGPRLITLNFVSSQRRTWTLTP